MNIIDQYIADHYYDSMDLTAARLGISLAYAYERKAKVEIEALKLPVEIPSGVENEMAALINLITIRQTGWAVEAAKVRLNKLENYRNF